MFENSSVIHHAQQAANSVSGSYLKRWFATSDMALWMKVMGIWQTLFKFSTTVDWLYDFRQITWPLNLSFLFCQMTTVISTSLGLYED